MYLLSLPGTHIGFLLARLKRGFHGSAHVSKSILSLASNQCYHFKNRFEM